MWDPFEAYHQGLVTSPNVAVFGEPGMRKSTLVKTFLWRMFSLYGDRRWAGIADPKGEYTELADLLGLPVLRLSPGGITRVNPLAPGPPHRTRRWRTPPDAGPTPCTTSSPRCCTGT
jgi:hypothetical protein